MLPTVPVQRKYLLLFNRQSRNMLKSELVPAPSKLSEEDVMMYFKKHLMAKGAYFVPKAVVVLKADEEEYRILSEKKETKPRAPRAKKEIAAVAPAPLVSVIPPGPPAGSAEAAAIAEKSKKDKAAIEEINALGRDYMITLGSMPKDKQRLAKLRSIRSKYNKMKEALVASGYKGVIPVLGIEKTSAPKAVPSTAVKK